MAEAARAALARDGGGNGGDVLFDYRRTSPLFDY
jgi:hypothetical protein